jgi:phosphatidylserine decarboxylase
MHAPAQAIVSPADGQLQAVGTIDADGLIDVKGRGYRAAELLIDEREIDRYLGGQYAVVYLSPRDYHRVHAPAAGRLAEIRSAPGELFPVNRISELHIPRFLTRNRRVAIVIDSPSHGRVTVVMVAAMIVGRITVTGLSARDVPFGRHRIEQSVMLERGDEIGIFHLGSTAVVLVEPRAEARFVRPAGPVQLGQALSLPQEERDG